MIVNIYDGRKQFGIVVFLDSKSLSHKLCIQPIFLGDLFQFFLSLFPDGLIIDFLEMIEDAGGALLLSLVL